MEVCQHCPRPLTPTLVLSPESTYSWWRVPLESDETKNKLVFLSLRVIRSHRQRSLSLICFFSVVQETLPFSIHLNISTRSETLGLVSSNTGPYWPLTDTKGFIFRHQVKRQTSDRPSTTDPLYPSLSVQTRRLQPESCSEPGVNLFRKGRLCSVYLYSKISSWTPSFWMYPVFRPLLHYPLGDWERSPFEVPVHCAKGKHEIRDGRKTCKSLQATHTRVHVCRDTHTWTDICVRPPVLH